MDDILSFLVCLFTIALIIYGVAWLAYFMVCYLPWPPIL